MKAVVWLTKQEQLCQKHLSEATAINCAASLHISHIRRPKRLASPIKNL